MNDATETTKGETGPNCLQPSGSAVTVSKLKEGLSLMKEAEFWIRNAFPPGKGHVETMALLDRVKMWQLGVAFHISDKSPNKSAQRTTDSNAVTTKEIQ